MEVTKEVFIYLQDDEATLLKDFFWRLQHKQCVEIMMSGVNGDRVHKLLHEIKDKM